MGKGQHKIRTIKYVTSNSQTNSHSSIGGHQLAKYYVIHFTYSLFLYLTRRTINNYTPHLKTTKEPNKKNRLGQSATKLLLGGGLQLVCGRPTLAFSSALVPQTLGCSFLFFYNLGLRWLWEGTPTLATQYEGVSYVTSAVSLSRGKHQ